MIMAPAKGGTKRTYSINQDVLARWSDGLFYLGTILTVDETNCRCYIRFEDRSEHWTMYKDIQRGPSRGEIVCTQCQGGHSDPPNEIVICDSCNLGFHQDCHTPAIGPDVLKPEVVWKCRLCVFATTAKKGGAAKKGPNAQVLQAMKQSLPYDPSKLTWDSHHKVNAEQIYCYCGGPGDWYIKMLQCGRCRQWFHEACLQCLIKPLLYGDRLYVFICSFCNSGPEYLTRLQPRWQDVCQLALFNLTVVTHKKYHHFQEKLLDWINNNWELVQAGKLNNTAKDDRPRKVLKALQLNIQKFQNARENKKCGSLWGLRVRIPPPTPHVTIPPDVTITDSIFYSIESNNSKKKSSKSPQKEKKRKANHDTNEEVKLRKTKKPRLHSKSESTENSHSQPKSSSVTNGTTSTATVATVATPATSTPKQPTKENGRGTENHEAQTLDTIIPWPSSYEGLNHPFKTVLEKNEEIQHTKIKAKLLNSYQNGTVGVGGGSEESDTATESDSQALSSASEDQSQLAAPQPTHPPSTTTAATTTTSDASVIIKPLRKKRGRKSKAELLAIAEAEAQAKAIAKDKEKAEKKKRLQATLKLPVKTPHHAKNVVDKTTLDGMCQREVPINQLRSSVSSYFGAVDRLKNGEKFQVLARRVTPDGKVQYLIEWEGFLT